MENALIYKLYAGLGRMLRPIAPRLLQWRARKGKEDASRQHERLGKPQRPRPDGALIWLHGASVGEVNSLLPLIQKLVDLNFNVMLTSGTLTSAKLAASRLPKGAFHQYMPLDFPDAAQNFIHHWQPDLVIFVESELWPNFIATLSQKQTPLFLINARMSARSSRRWQKMPQFIKAMLQSFTMIIAQSEADAKAYAALGAPSVMVGGNLKYDNPRLPINAQQQAELRKCFSTRPIWLAASTHSGEDEVILSAHKALQSEYPTLLTLLAPRHPARAEAIGKLITEAELRYAQRSLGAMPQINDDVYLIDTIGELGLFYALSPVSFIGGSLIPHGGQNPIEPAQIGSAILHGEHVFNFAQVYAALDAEKAAIFANNSAEITKSVRLLLNNKPQREAQIQQAASVIAGFQGAVERVLTSLAPYLQKLRN